MNLYAGYGTLVSDLPLCLFCCPTFDFSLLLFLIALILSTLTINKSRGNLIRNFLACFTELKIKPWQLVTANMINAFSDTITIVATITMSPTLDTATQ